ncbi:Ig-like domain-containing protein, partial [Klebsiella aerogenes]|uniref:Ig-like domain-containing protein n=1 Tax=Klebsiella aerogenes TaxID=548 RepID=UPI0037C00796
MSQFTLTVNDGQQPSQLFKLQTPVNADDIVSLPLLEQGYYLLDPHVALSRQGDTLRIHADTDSAPAAIIPDYYTTSALLTIPVTENKVQAIDTMDVTAETASVGVLTESTPDVPGAPGFVIIDGVADNEGAAGEIENKGATDDLTPTLHGQVPHGEGMVLRIYANTVLLGTTLVDADGNWSFTPDREFEINSSYTFEVLFQDAGGSSVLVAMPFEISIVEDGTVPADDLPEPGNNGTLDIIGVDDDEGLHTGNVVDGGITDDLTPTLRGHEPHAAGQIIKIYANTVLLGSLVVDENGDWSFPTELAANSRYTFEVLLQDAGGNAIVTSMPYTITTGFDYATPAIVSAEDASGIFTGPISEGQPTDETNPILSGTSDPGVMINLYDGDVLLGSTTADASGVWTFTPTIPLTGDGEHVITATATDGTNESARSGGFIITLDTVCEKPVITGIEDDAGSVTGNILDNGNHTDDGNVVVSGTAEPGSTITLFFTGQDNAIDSIDVQLNADGTWSVPVDFMAMHGEGTYTYWVLSYDQAGNKAVSDKVTVEYSTTPPDAVTSQELNDDVGSITGPISSGDITDDNQPEYNGEAEPGSTIIISDNGTVIGSVTADEKGHWSFTPETPLNDGAHSFSVVVEDANGLQSEPSEAIDFTVDTQAPEPIDIKSPDNLVVTDDVGSVTGPVEQGGVTDDTKPTFTGENQTPGNIVIVMDNGAELGSAVVDENGKWSFTPETAMAEGAHEIELIAADAAGNRSEPSSAFDFVIDTVAPDAATDQQLLDD